MEGERDRQGGGSDGSRVFSVNEAGRGGGVRKSVPAIVTENLVKRLGDLTAVDGLTIEVRPGELFAFLGPNGAGKTTTIHMLCTLLRPTAGSARGAGHDCVKEAWAGRRAIGPGFL